MGEIAKRQPKPTTVTIFYENSKRRLQCNKCDHIWTPRVKEPVQCGGCKRPIMWERCYEVDSRGPENPESEEGIDDGYGNNEEEEEDGEIIDGESPEYNPPYDPDNRAYPETDPQENYQHDPQIEHRNTRYMPYPIDRTDPMSNHQREQLPPEYGDGSQLPFKQGPVGFQNQRDYRHNQQTQQQPQQPQEEESGGMDISFIFEMLIPMFTKSFFPENEEHEQTATQMLLGLVQQNGKEISDEIFGAIGNMAGAGAAGGMGVNPLYVKLGLPLMTIFAMKMNENKTDKKTKEKMEEEEAKLEKQIEEIEKEKEEEETQAQEPPVNMGSRHGRRKSRRRTSFVVTPPEEAPGIEFVKPETEEVEYVEEEDGDYGGESMDEVLEITDDEIMAGMEELMKIPPQVLKIVVDSGMPIFGNKQMNNALRALDHEQMIRIINGLDLPFDTLFGRLDVILAERAPKYHEILCSEKGKNFLEKNLPAFRETIITLESEIPG